MCSILEQVDGSPAGSGRTASLGRGCLDSGSPGGPDGWGLGGGDKARPLARKANYQGRRTHSFQNILCSGALAP